MIFDSVIGPKTKVESVSISDDNIGRNMAKTVSWRMIGTIDTIIISWIVTGTLALAFSIGAIELISKMALYIFHERAWNNIKWEK
jgi:uncharacterized membrane protein